jgi:hypothetical protein
MESRHSSPVLEDVNGTILASPALLLPIPNNLPFRTLIPIPIPCHVVIS